MKLSEQISTLRKEQKMSQEELAAAMNVSRQAVSKWENGQSNPDTENLIRLAEIFGVDINELIQQENSVSEGSISRSPRAGVPTAFVWVLGILLAIAIAVAIVFACLWQQAIQPPQESTPTPPSTEAVETAWENVKMYHNWGQEVSLTEQQQINLVEFIVRFHYTPGPVVDGKNENGETIYGGRNYIVEYTCNGTAYRWRFTDDGFHYSIAWPNGETADFYYEVDYVLFYELDRYIY